MPRKRGIIVSFISFDRRKRRGIIPKEIQSRELYWHYSNQWGSKGTDIGATSAILKDDWKLIYYHRDQSVELFNLTTDIGEQNNLSSKNKLKVKVLSTLLGRKLKQSNAQMPQFKNGREMFLIRKVNTEKSSA